MADTILTLDQLAVLLADNKSGQISPQDVRDLMVSLAQIIKESGGTEMTLGAIADGEGLKRVGTQVVGVADMPPSGPAGGDLEGEYPDPTVKQSSETVAGKIELATQVETDNGTDDARAVTPLKAATNPRLPTQAENDAQAGTDGTPSGTNKYVTNSDPRNADARVPTAHAIGGAEHTASLLAALNALISDATLDDVSGSRTPVLHAIGGPEHSASLLAALNALLSDANLDDSGASRPPLAHAADHKAGGISELPGTSSVDSMGAPTRAWFRIFTDNLSPATGNDFTISTVVSLMKFKALAIEVFKNLEFKDQDGVPVQNLVWRVIKGKFLATTLGNTEGRFISRLSLELLDAADVASGAFADARISESSVTQHVAAIDHDALLNFLIAQHRIINDAGDSSIELLSSQKILALTSAISAGIDVKPLVDTSTEGLGNITLNGEQTLNGLLTSSSRVMVVEQTLGEDNGIYVSAAGAWSRAPDSDTDAEVTNGNTTTVGNSGSTKFKNKYILVTADPITVGTTVQTWEEHKDINFGTVAGTATEGDDSRVPTQDENDALVGTSGAPSTANKYVTNADARNSDARTPTAHGASHTDGSDDIQDATAAQKGLATIAQISKLDGIELLATADQTDAEIETAYNNQVPIVSQGDAEAGTATVAERWTPERVAQAIAALIAFADLSGQAATAQIADNAITNPKLADMPTKTIKGNDTGGSADPKDLTTAETRALLGLPLDRFQFFADQLENPVNADWAINALAPAVADSNNNGLTVRLFDDTVEEGVGFILAIPADAVNIKLSFKARAETGPPAARTVGLKLYERGIPDDAAVDAWSAGTVLTDIDIPTTNEFFQYDSQTFTLAALGLTAGQVHQFELTRINPAGGTELVGDWVLLSLEVELT